MRRTVLIPVLLGIVGLSIAAIVRAQNPTETTADFRQSPADASAVRLASDDSSSPTGSRRPKPLFGRIGLPWSGNSQDRTPSGPTVAEPTASPPARLSPVAGAAADSASVEEPAEETSVLTNSSRLQRRLQALRQGDSISQSPRTANLPTETNRTTSTRPTLATPHVAGESTLEPAAPSVLPLPINNQERSVLNSNGSDTEPAVINATPAPTVRDSQGGDSADQLPSILKRRPSGPSDAKISDRPGEAEAASPDTTPSEPNSLSSRRRKPTELDEATGQKHTATAASPRRLFAGKLPTIELETIGSQTIVVGKETSFIIRAKNLGNEAIEMVTVDVGIPASAELKGNTATNGAAQYGMISDQQAGLQWKIGSLAPNSPEELVVKIVPRDARAFELSTTWNVAPIRQLAQIRVLEPKLEMHLTGPPEVLFGDTKFFTITISNPGTGTTEEVSVNLMPINPGEESPGRTTIGPIEAGGRKEIEIELTARQAGKIEIRAEATAENGLRAEAMQDVLVRRADLELAVEAPQIKYAGTMAVYRITVTNQGDAAAENVQATATLPAGSKFVPASNGGKHDLDAGTVSWTVGPLRPAESRVLELHCVLAMAGNNQLQLQATATGDLLASQTAHTLVEALADLKLTLTDPKGPLPVGEEVQYEVRISNRGTKAAESVNLVVYFSEGLEPQSVDGGRAELEKGQVVFEVIPRIDAGQELSFTVKARAERPGNLICRTEVQCTEPETRLANEETTRFYGNPTAADKPREARRSPTAAPLAPQQMESYR